MKMGAVDGVQVQRNTVSAVGNRGVDLLVAQSP
jgi:hypothetical protein